MDDLIERLEAALEGSAELDIEIAKATIARLSPTTEIEYRVGDGNLMEWRCRHEEQDWGSWWHGVNYTQSIDAAITLVTRPANCWGIDQSPLNNMAHVSRNNVKEGHWMVEAEHPTSAPIALCIAALIARKHHEAP